MEPKKHFWQSPNFMLAVLIVIGGFFVGFPENAAADAVASIFTLVGSGGLLLKFARSKPGTKVKGWIQDANFWNYLSVIVISILPQVGPALLPGVEDLTENLLQGNLGGALMAGISLITIIVKMFQKPKAIETPG